MTDYLTNGTKRERIAPTRGGADADITIVEVVARSALAVRVNVAFPRGAAPTGLDASIGGDRDSVAEGKAQWRKSVDGARTGGFETMATDATALPATSVAVT
jgi:hypothetical protein